MFVFRPLINCDIDISMSAAPATQLVANVSESIIEPKEVQSDNAPHKFDLKILRDAFVHCVQPDHTLLLAEYVRAYEELCL